PHHFLNRHDDRVIVVRATCQYTCDFQVEIARVCTHAAVDADLQRCRHQVHLNRHVLFSLWVDEVTPDLSAYEHFPRIERKLPLSHLHAEVGQKLRIDAEHLTAAA